MTSKKGLERKEALLQAASESFAQKGIHDTSILDITARTQLGKSTFYHYFESKEALVELYVNRGIEKSLTEINLILSNGDIPFCKRLKDCLTRVYEISFSTIDLLEVVGQRIIDAFVLRSAELLSGFMEEGVRLGFVHTPQPRATTYIVTLGLESVWRAYRHDALPFPDNSFETLLSAIEAIFHMEPRSLLDCE